MRTQTIISSALLILAAVAIWIISASFPNLEEGYPGPALFPRIIAVLLGVCGLLLALQSHFKTRIVATKTTAENEGKKSQAKIIAALVLLIAFPLIIDSVGFIYALGGLCFCVSLLFGVKPLWGFVSATLTALAIYGLFDGLLGVPL